MLSLEDQDGTHSVAAIELRDSTRESGYAGQAFDFACQVPPGDATEYAARDQR